MSVNNCTQEHKKIFDTFKRILPEGEELDALKRSIQGYGEESLTPFDYYKTIEKELQSELGDDMSSLLINYLVNPKDHHYDWRAENQENVINDIAMIMARAHCEMQPSQASADAILERFVRMFKDPQGSPEIEPDYNISEKEMRRRYYFPKVDDCLEMLIKHLEFDSVMNTLSDIYQGKYNQLIDYGEDAYKRYVNTNAHFIGDEYREFGKYIQAFFRTGGLTYEWFKQAHMLYPDYSRPRWVYPITGDSYDEYYRDKLKSFDPEFLKIYKDYYTRLVHELIADMPETSGVLCRIVSDASFPGITWLKTGMELIKVHALKANDLKDRYEDLANCIRPLIDSYGLEDGETEQQLIEMLSGYSERELLVALPYAGCAREAILKALGWDSVLLFQKQLFILGGANSNTHDDVEDIYNCESPMSGVINRCEWQDIVDNIDEKQVAKYIKALRASSLSFTNLLMLVSAVMGIEKDKIEKKLVRHGQAAIKAYGLYAVENEDELRERYIKFKTMHKEATQYGPERQANTQAAVKAGIKNLAQTAGYTDDIRLEWAMEADIATSMIPFDTDYEVEAWTARLVLEGITPKINISKQGKPLKSVPPKVRGADIYQQMRTAQDTVRGQASRFRRTLEDMMCGREAIPAEELETLSRLPVVSAMLSQLILKTQDNQFGFFSGKPDTLIGIDGQKITIKDDPIIAHVYDLFNAGILPDWQKVVVKQRIVQPFKQAFRELYVVTPAETETKNYSRRFVGHVIDGAIASRLLQSRRWSQANGDVVEVYKRFPAHGFYAEIGLPDSRHYLAEDTTTMDEIWFQGKEGRIDLDKVDPVVFSEVMRDMDLLASVAQVGDDDIRWSTETAERRTELIINLMDDIGLSQVTCEGHYAFIEGKLAKYRIHLGSGVVHIQPGNYLCIVPENQKNEELYLPFADADKRMAEIISKIFLLISDDQITDKTILEQINSSVELTN